MTVDGVTADVSERLRAAGCVYAEEEARLLLAATDDQGELSALVDRRVAGEPLEQVLGWVDLGGLRLRVARGCFVPRQRTLLLVRHAVAATRAAGPGAVMVEAYAGVAPVAAHVRRAVPEADVHAVEGDERALAAARDNLGPGGAVRRGDGLAGLPDRLAGRVDVLAAVTPYVPDGEWALLPREARDHEPSNALLGGADGLDHVRTLLADAPGWLAPDAVLLTEVGADQAEGAVAEAARLGWQATTTISDRTAMVHGSRVPG